MQSFSRHVMSFTIFAVMGLALSASLQAQVPAATVPADLPKPGAPAGKIASIEGPADTTTIDIRNGQALTTAAAGDTIYVGDHILTPSTLSVSVTLADESEVVIGPDSDFMVKQTGTELEPTTHLQMLYGMLHAVVKKIYTDEHPFLVETPTSVMGVRGTEFVVELDKATGDSTVHTLEGSVAMARSRSDFRNPANYAEVSAGNMTAMKKGMALPPPAKPFQRQALFQRLSQRAPHFTKHIEARRVLRQQHPQQKRPPQTQAPRATVRATPHAPRQPNAAKKSSPKAPAKKKRAAKRKDRR